jgi:hypothetical protein
MNKEQILPTVIILISCGASIFYAFGGDWRRTIYWAAAATLNFVVTY